MFNDFPVFKDSDETGNNSNNWGGLILHNEIYQHLGELHNLVN